MSADAISCVTAPGKLMVCGEYAVLQGAEAVVAAVDRRAGITHRARSMRPSEPATDSALPPEVTRTRALAEARVGPLPGRLSLDVAELRRGDQKLGLGSSAAAAAATAGSVYLYHGRNLSGEQTRKEMLSVALEGHRAVAPSGSGADVAAATLGGFVGVQPEPAGLRTRVLRLPPTVTISVVWMGQAARTSDLVSQVRELAVEAPKTHDELMSELSLQARDFLAAAEMEDAAKLVSAADAYGRGMQRLGQAAGAPIVTPALEALAERARALGGAAKPSGAGGGDVALGFFTTLATRHQFEIGCRECNLTVLPLHLGAEGVRPADGVHLDDR